jgi:glutamate-1-semialdehyde aminotransferase
MQKAGNNNLQHRSFSGNSVTAATGRVMWEYAESDDSDAYGSQQAMWRAVIVQALMDAASQSKKPEAEISRREAMVWLRGKSADFKEVCENAGFDPEFVREMAAKCLADGCAWRKAPGFGDRYGRADRRKSDKKPYQSR